MPFSRGHAAHCGAYPPCGPEVRRGRARDRGVPWPPTGLRTVFRSNPLQLYDDYSVAVVYVSHVDSVLYLSDQVPCTSEQRTRKSRQQSENGLHPRMAFTVGAASEHHTIVQQFECESRSVSLAAAVADLSHARGGMIETAGPSQGLRKRKP